MYVIIVVAEPYISFSLCFIYATPQRSFWMSCDYDLPTSHNAPQKTKLPDVLCLVVVGNLQIFSVFASSKDFA